MAKIRTGTPQIGLAADLCRFAASGTTALVTGVDPGPFRPFVIWSDAALHLHRSGHPMSSRTLAP